MKTTKGGPDTYVGLLEKTDLGVWCDCFTAAIAGTVAAHRGEPNPNVVVRIASSVADRALRECTQRRKR